MVRYNVEQDVTGEKTLACSFSERLDTDNCFKFSNDVLEKVRESKIPVIFDLEKVDYISSIFLGLCLRIAKEVGFQNFTIVNTKPNVLKVFKIAGVDKHITIR